MTKNIIFIFLGYFVLFSCSQKAGDKGYYPKDSTISGIDGKPKDSLSFYYPKTIQTDTQMVETQINTSILEESSNALYIAQEPILYNYYTGHDIYRFLLLPSFNSPVLFSLHKHGDKVWLTTKRLDRPNIEIDITELNKNDKLPVDSASKVEKVNRKVIIALNETKQLSKKEWLEFEKLLNDYSFWSLKPYGGIIGYDGETWIIEGHLRNKYWFVKRWSPKDNFRKIGKYLIDKSTSK